MRRNYTVCLPSLTSDKKENKDRGKNIDLIIKHYADGVLTPLLNRLDIGKRTAISFFFVFLQETSEKGTNRPFLNYVTNNTCLVLKRLPR